MSHRHVQRVEDQFGAQMVGHRPPHHPAAEHIEYDGQVQESRRGRDVGDVGHPQSVRGLGHEATLDQVRRGAGLGVTTRGARSLATTHPGQACLTHLSTFTALSNSRGPFLWTADGALDANQRALRRAGEMLRAYEPPPMDEAIDEALRACIAKREEELPDGVE